MATQAQTHLLGQLSYEPRMGRILDKDGQPICMVYSNNEQSNAAFIIHACNSFEELLATAESASHALHEVHPREFNMPVGRGICGWGPCKRLFDAITKATSQQAQ